MNRSERKFVNKLADGWVDTTPSLQIQAYTQGKKKIDLTFGEYYQYFDLASLTKVLFTGRALMTLFAEKKCKKLSLVHSILPWWPHQETNLQQLLTHSSGMIWWKPYYEELNKLSLQTELRYKWLAQLLSEAPIQLAPRSVYSDSGFLLLGFILEALTEKTLQELWLSNQDRWSTKNDLHFRPLFAENLKNQSKYAPTEKCPWSNQILQGVVHDENARSLGGIAPHAGLFGSITDVSQYLLNLRKILREEVKQPVVSAQVVKSFIRRAIPKSRGDWTLGWMLPTKGGSSSGRYFSSTSVGHTGFTGTSMWWDLEKDNMVVILSNRVNFGRENKSFAQIRPLLHDLIIESLEV